MWDRMARTRSRGSTAGAIGRNREPVHRIGVPFEAAEQLLVRHRFQWPAVIVLVGPAVLGVLIFAKVPKAQALVRPRTQYIAVPLGKRHTIHRPLVPDEA